MQDDQYLPASLSEDLKKLGCSAQMIEQIMTDTHPERALRLLYQYRFQLLTRLHDDQRRIDQLDELLYRLKMSKGGIYHGKYHI